ncbi:MAG: PQQ-binding-like beta-propeller repeat protein [Candidatus Brocadiia bacterium]
MSARAVLVPAILFFAWGPVAPGADWPMWRGNAARTAASAHDLPRDLRLQWVRHLLPQVPAWKDEGAMQFDRGYLPVALDGRLFVASTANDRLTAYDLATGEELWRFYAGGPIRVAPAAWRDRVFVASDDGFLSCLGAAGGRVLWKYRGGPFDRRLVGNQRVVASWPARGGPVVADGRVYFAAGLWPFMGTFVHAVDAVSGERVWTNDATSFSWRRFPHPGSWSLSGLSPQGHLAAVGDRLIVPGSRYKPAVFDRRTGAFLFYGEGLGPSVASRDGLAFAGGHGFHVATGREVRLEGAKRVRRCVLGEGAWYIDGRALDPSTLELREATIHLRETTQPDSPTYPKQIFQGTIERLPGRLPGTPRLLAGSTLVVTGKGAIQAFDVSDPSGEPQAVWEAPIEGQVADVLAASGRLVATTLDGRILCYGQGEAEPRRHPLPEPERVGWEAWAGTARRILDATGVCEGICLVWDLRDGGLVEELVRRSELHLVAVDADAEVIGRLRRRLDAAGLYGSRAAACLGEPQAIGFAPYLAELVVSEDPEAAGLGQGRAFVERLFRALRPYGGLACLPLSERQHGQFAQAVAAAALEGAEMQRAGELTILRRVGALPGAADWCGQNADAGNTRCSRDRRVRLPLGVLWFGNALSNRRMLPKHGEGPVEQVAGGRLFVEGPDGLSACDVYTGRVLWTREFPGLGAHYDIVRHQRGAHAIGSNFYAVPDAVYVAAGKSCHLLDPATGQTVRRFRLPLREGDEERSPWLFLLVCGDVLIAGSHPVVEATGGRYVKPASSRRLVAMDRHTGRVLWTRDAAESFGHYGLVAGGGKVFCRDRVAPETREALERRGVTSAEEPHILALDVRTGAVVWTSERCVGDELAYSREHDVLLADGALRGQDGAVLWEAPTLEGYARHPNPALDSRDDPLWWGKWGPILCDRTVFTQGQRAFDLLTGVQRTWRQAGGGERGWRFRRFHGCGPAAGSVHLLTFRSGCAGFYDLAADDGTGNLGGFRSGCTSNLIAADGVLNAPDYTRACTCAYQNRASLALVHMPELEYWTFGGNLQPGRLGLNFGAPGDRRAADGTLWLDVPSVGGPSPHVEVQVRPRTARTFRHYVTWVRGGEGLPWVAASGLVGAREIAVTPPRAGTYTVRLAFVEPEELGPGQRVFAVALQGERALPRLDVARAAGGPRRGLVRDFGPIAVRDRLVVGLRPEPGSKPAVLCGIHLVVEEERGETEGN